MMLRLPNMPVLVINLQRQSDRKECVTGVLKSLGCKDIRIREGYDGRELLKSAGRCRKEPDKGVYRFCYDEFEDGVKRRAQWCIRGNSIAVAGSADVWGQHGCSRSHFDVLGEAAEFLKKHACVAIAEDDLRFGSEFQSAKTVAAEVRKQFKLLCQKYPSWTCWQLEASRYLPRRAETR